MYWLIQYDGFTRFNGMQLNVGVTILKGYRIVSQVCTVYSMYYVVVLTYSTL
jgi:hypothetical protein